MATGLAREAYINKSVILEYANKASSIQAFGGFPKVRAIDRVQIAHSDGKHLYSIEFGRMIFL